ncbi:LOW QUALITY PROTEIN: uncharacterized protein [Aquarana catesbeiana]|uniref:LOW QUALITY PROTEIN: uncharacterized protein n=1 Tax=Aquarana catesbeiana TaxID=8400 RepID=UPI003CC9AD35
MPDESFQLLLSKVSPLITKKDTVLRPSIPAEQRLVATLRFLATGRSYEDLKFTTGISAQSLGRIIPETCQAIKRIMQEEYLKLLSSVEEWKSTAKQFQDYWNFPNCGGAIDGKHVRIIPPANSGSFFYNYKGYFSIVLMAIVNAKYEFIFVDIGKNGRNSDGGIIEKTSFFHHLKNGLLHLPSQEDTVEGLNSSFVADDAFALSEHILKPFALKNLTPEQKIFNYRLSRARRVVENAFGIMANHFRIFHTAINVAPPKNDTIVHSCCVLHNFLRRTSSNYMPQSQLDREDTLSGDVTPEEDIGGFDFSMVSLLIKAIKEALKWEDPSTPPAKQKKFFKHLGKERSNFPLLSELKDIINEEGSRTDKKSSMSNKTSRLYPFKSEEVKCLENAALMHLAKHVTLPLEDAVSFRDGLERRIDQDLKKIYGLAGTACKPALALAAMSKAIEAWTENVDSFLKSVSEELAGSSAAAELKLAAVFLGEASIHLIRLLARIMLASVTAKRALWLLPWLADPVSKQAWCKIPFEGSSLFGNKLDDAMTRAMCSK